MFKMIMKNDFRKIQKYGEIEFRNENNFKPNETNE